MYTVVFANGIFLDSQRARNAAESADLVIAANGGALHCLRLDLTPDIVVGDIDSLEESNRQVLESNGAEFVVHPSEKDQTDLEIALKLAVGRKATRIVALGTIGGRLDMSIANVLLLMLPELAGVEVEVWHADQTARLLSPPGGPLRGKIGETISLIALDGNARGVTTNDLQYALDDETLPFVPARGVSNVISGPDPHVKLREGNLLAVHAPIAT